MQREGAGIKRSTSLSALENAAAPTQASYAAAAPAAAVDSCSYSMPHFVPSHPLPPSPVKTERPRKRLKLDCKPPATPEIANLRKLICDYKHKLLSDIKEAYTEHRCEQYFLQTGGNITDYYIWKKKPSIQLFNFIRSNPIDSDDEDEKRKAEVGKSVRGDAGAILAQLNKTTADVGPAFKDPKVTSINTTSLGALPGSYQTAAASPPHRFGHLVRSALPGVTETVPSASEVIVERAKQEAQVMQRVAELRKQGLWSAKRLPKVQEPPRSKAHWDYLLEEMQWLAADFAQERKWKRAGCRKIARLVARYFQDKVDAEKRAEKEGELRIRKVASLLAKCMRDFWCNIEKVVQFKQQSRLEEKRRKALDTHLNFIVDQTEKYSSWLTEGLGRSSVGTTSVASSLSGAVNDDEFEGRSESDDEETIAREELDLDEEMRRKEIEELEKEGLIPLEDLLRTLPQAVLDKPASISDCESDPEDSAWSKASHVSDEEFAASEGSTDDEATLDEQEAHEKVSEDTDDELNQLKTESELPVAKLLEIYTQPYDDELPETPLSSQTLDSSGDSADDDNNSKDAQVGIEFLLHPEKTEGKSLSQEDEGPNKEITDIAAAAQSLQPTGYTLETTMVKTPIPMLLKLPLREYQHVGLDWLATMYEKKLNGILADEMGLGKTIQTIALFTHLACEHGVWGPHLIVVPTSVMLNWEMEFKKWCPSFKLLTYYGTPKERKLKRQGWTKTNAFHVCITSYKLVIQDHQSFRRKKWKYLVLDEAQNIKNFKSQRWQTLLNFSSQRRLLLTGTPLQNSLMELWSLMHFLMPNVFSSHNEFKEWFANPLTGMIEGNQEYNENLIRRLHKVLRPFLLRRLKQDVEKQMPKKYEHVVMCRLSKRQRFLYDDFMSQRQTKEVLASGQFLSVINILMQLRKVCNHPDLFDPRPIVSPFQTGGITYDIPSLILGALEYNPFKHVSSDVFHPSLASLELGLSAYAAHRIRKLQTPRKLIEEIDDQPEPQPRHQPTKLRPFVIKTAPVMQQGSISTSMLQRPSSPHVGKATLMKGALPAAVLQPKGSMVACSTSGVQITTPPSISGMASTAVPFQVKPLNVPISLGATLSQPITLQIQQTQQGARLMLPGGLPTGFLQIVQSGHVLPPAANQPMVPLVNNTSAIVSVATTSAVTASSASVNNGVPVGSARAPGQVSHPPANSIMPSAKPAVRQHTVGTESTERMSPLTSSAQVTRRVSIDDTLSRGPKDFALAHLLEKKINRRKETLLRIATINKKHCCWKPIYGRDLCEAVSVWKGCSKALLHGCLPGESFMEVFQSGCSGLSDDQWLHTTILGKCLRSPEMWLDELKDIVERFVFVTPAVVASRGVVQRAAHYPSARAIMDSERERVIREDGAPLISFLHPVQTRMKVQFPEKRLIQYDCGKLQTLDILLRDLKKSGHRVLIFTQMTRMLDVLEAFLNFHGYRYLRLDGTTRVENRQILMDRFNLDTKIFCFILSTRSGGIGVNLTGADTVIFYDSDWNPTMDAQAQDRCHRIGQTRDVHIYRLISEKTVEENILKKSNQKKMLGDVAIEGGNFTTAFFKEQTIKELFEEPSGLRVMAEQLKAFEQAKAVSVTSSKPVSGGNGDSAITQSQLEQALCNVEDEPDIQAAIVARAEQSAELAEFDENIPWDEKEADQRKRDEENPGSKVEEEIASIEKELKPIERYAVRFLEETEEQFSSDALKMAEEDIETAKQEWELARLKALRDEEERKAELEDDEVLFTYSRDDSVQVFKDVLTDEEMGVWGPPTPPSSDSDMYIDSSLNFLYESSIMSESMLPPIYTKREKKRIKQEALSGRKRMRFDEVPRVPRSLFDRPNATLLKMRRDLKAQKHGSTASGTAQRSIGGGGVYSGTVSSAQQTGVAAAAASGAYTGMKPPMPLVAGRPAVADVPHDQPEWLIHEDWALLQAVQTLLQMPLNLTVVSPAHIANWDLVADTVNAVSRIYRSPKQCKIRYENIIIPREEGRILYDITPRKPAKKGKGIYKTRNNRPMKTSQLYMQDHGSSVTTLHAFRFDCIKNISARRVPTLRPTLVHPMTRNPKHTAVLTESGINYDQPMTPVQVAAIRQDRIAKEKKQQSQAAGTGSTAGAPTPVSAIPVVTVAPLPVGSGSLATVATPVCAAPVEQQIQLLTSRSLTMSAIPQALPAGLVQQRGTSAILPVVPGMALAQTGIAPQQLQSVASLNIAASSATVANVLAAASLQRQPGQSVSIARSLGSGGIVVSTAGSSMSPAAAISKRGVPQLPAVAAVVAAAAAAPVQAAAGMAALPGATATMATLQRGSRPMPLAVGDLRMAAAPTATQIRQLQGAAASCVVPTAAVTAAVTVQQQMPQSRLLQQPPQQLIHVKQQQMIKQRSAVSSPVGALTQRLPGSAQLTQASQQLTQIQHSSAVSVATLVKSVTAGSMTSSVTLPVTAVSVGGVNINVSLPHQHKVAVANQALVKASSVSPPVSGQQPNTRPLPIQQVPKQKPTPTPQLTQKVALPVQMQQVGKLPMASGQVQVVPSKVNTSIAQLQQIMQHQHKQLHITGVQQTSSPTIIAMHSVPPAPGSQVTKLSASGVAAASLGTVSMASARQIPMQTTLTIMPTASATSLVAPSTVQSSSSSTSNSLPSSSPSQ